LKITDGSTKNCG